MSLASSAPEAWRDRLRVPHYQVGEAARYAGLATSTIVGWQKTVVSDRDFGSELSYLQLIEIAVVSSMRKGGIRLDEIRATRAFMQDRYKSEYPFAEYKFKHDGRALWLSDRDIPGVGKKRGHLIRTGRGGQLAWAPIIGRLKEFVYDRQDIVVRWRVAGPASPVLIDPRVSYGSPAVRGVPTWIIKGRWTAGEAISDIADDFNLKERDVADALKFEGMDLTAPPQRAWLN